MRLFGYPGCFVVVCDLVALLCCALQPLVFVACGCLLFVGWVLIVLNMSLHIIVC